MKNTILVIVIGGLIFFPFYNISSAFDGTSDFDDSSDLIDTFDFDSTFYPYVTISGSSQFSSSLRAKYMKKHGYVYIKEFSIKRYLKANVFAANDAEVIIKNKYNAVVSTTRTDEKGNFSVTLPKDNVYNVIVRFHGREIKEEVEPPDTEGITLSFGFFKSDTVGSWFEKIRLSNCFTCDVRHLEAY